MERMGLEVIVIDSPWGEGANEEKLAEILKVRVDGDQDHFYQLIKLEMLQKRLQGASLPRRLDPGSPAVNMCASIGWAACRCPGPGASGFGGLSGRRK